MDLSGLIFVALFAAWAIYLIPRAMNSHEDLARTRSVQNFSERVRVFANGLGARSEAAPVDEAEGPVADDARRVVAKPRTLASARKAAARRRRVLLALLVVAAAVAGVATAGYAPWWSLAIPSAMVVGFLVVARLSVRPAKPKVRKVRKPAPVSSAIEEASAETPEPVAVAPRVVEAAPGDDGLWDPLPLTLPTYVTKPSARRTVRSIELTGLVSSGHDAEDSRLARAAEAAKAFEMGEIEQPERRVAGA